MAVEPFVAAAVQADIIDADHTDKDRARETILRNLDRQMELVDELWNWDSPYGEGGGPRLVAFPEFSMTTTPKDVTTEAFRNVAIEIPGEITDRIAETTTKYDIFIAMNAYEMDPEWEDRVFNTAFIVDPNGDVILRYRKLNSVQPATLTYSQPGDFWEEYIEHYGGPEALFPVAETEIGNLACFTAYDIRFAELARCMALNGAEIFLFLTGEPHSQTAWGNSWDSARITRAWENQCYLISPNSGMIRESLWPKFRQRGGSKIIDPSGAILAEIDGVGEASITATIDIEKLRRDRVNGVGRNVPATSRYWMYEEMYKKNHMWPQDVASDPPVTHEALYNAQDHARETALEKGVFTPPSDE